MVIGAIAKSVCQSVSLEGWRMAKCEVIDLTLSDSDSDGDFIQEKLLYTTSSFCKSNFSVPTTAGFMHVHSNVL